jgi:hypothetical protein
MTAGVAVATLVVLSASAARAQEAPLMIQTVPSLQGVELSLFGRAVATDGHGLAVATGAPGTYELSTPVSGAGENVRWEFSGWSDGSDSPTRPVTVSSFTFLEAGYDVYHRTSISLVAVGGREFPEPLDSVSLVDDRGERVVLSGDESVWLLARRAVEAPAGLASEEVGYRVQGISAGGRRVLPSRAQRLRPVPGGLLEIEVTPAEGAGVALATPEADPPTPESSSRANKSQWPLVVLVAAAVGLLALVGRGRAAEWARAGRLALRHARPALRRKLSPVGSGIAAAARNRGRGGRGILRHTARLASSLVAGASESVRSSGPRITAGAAQVVRWTAPARARAAHAWVAARSSARRVTISVRAAITSGARSGRRATAVGLRVVWAAARSAARTVATEVRGVRISAAVSATARLTRRVVAPTKPQTRVRSPRSEAEPAAAGQRERELVRVTLLDGRVIEGWWEAQAPGTGEDFFCLTHVSRVLESDGTDTVSKPVDAFIPVARIADIERAAAPPRDGVQNLPRAPGTGRGDKVSSSPG